MFWLGRRDSRKYVESLDGTLTHALIYVQGIAQSGQHSINKLYLEEVAKQASAISVLVESLSSLNQDFRPSPQSAKEKGGRAISRDSIIEAETRDRASDLRNQIVANQKRLSVLRLQAQQALESWVTYYHLLASIYVRNRMRLNGQIKPAEADVPTFKSISLSEVKDVPEGTKLKNA
jgi:hypothetical protein